MSQIFEGFLGPSWYCSGFCACPDFRSSERISFLQLKYKIRYWIIIKIKGRTFSYLNPRDSCWSSNLQLIFLLIDCQSCMFITDHRSLDLHYFVNCIVDLTGYGKPISQECLDSPLGRDPHPLWALKKIVNFCKK